MNIGGIETTLYKDVKFLIQNNIRVIWIKPKGGVIDPSFVKVMFSEKIEIYEIDITTYSWIKYLNLYFNSDEYVYARVTNLFNFILLEKIKRKYFDAEIHSVYWVPHFKGNGIFLENYAPRLLRSIIRLFLRNIIISMDKNNNILYGTKSHAQAYIDCYGYKIHNQSSMSEIAGFVHQNNKYNYEAANKRVLREEIRIITVTRFDFPHKAYVLGLTKLFSSFVFKYPNKNLILDIIGYGEGKYLLLDTINNLPLEIQNKIKLRGKVPYDKLASYFDNATVNIGMAGALMFGARLGVPSIPVRHYSDTCEAYGFLPEARDLTTSSLPGTPLIFCMDKLIAMTDEEYLNLSKLTFDSFNNFTSPLDSFFSFKNINYQFFLSNLYISIIYIFMIPIRNILKRCKKTF